MRTDIPFNIARWEMEPARNGKGMKGRKSCSLKTRQATGRPGARQRAAEEETAVI